MARGKAAPKTALSKQAKVKSKVVKVDKTKTVKSTDSQTAPEKEENAYERILCKVNQKRAAEGRALVGQEVEESQPKKSKPTKSLAEESSNENSNRVTARFVEDDNYIDMDISGIRSAFPSEDEDEEIPEVAQIDTDSKRRISLRELIQIYTRNVQVRRGRCQGQRKQQNGHVIKTTPSHIVRVSTQLIKKLIGLPECRAIDLLRLRTTITLMQDYMMEKGIIDNSMSEEEIKAFLAITEELNGSSKERDSQAPDTRESLLVDPMTHANEDGNQQKPTTKQNNANNAGKNNFRHSNMPRDSGSEVTVYSRAVKSVGTQEFGTDSVNNINDRLNQFLLNVREETADSRKISSSSEELMDTSDESAGMPTNNLNESVSVPHRRDAAPTNDVNPDESRNRTIPRGNVRATGTDRRDVPQDLALVLDAEQHKATMYEVPGKIKAITSLIDEDYQMIDAHIDETLKKKITSFEFIDFGRLISKGRFVHDEDNQRLEIVNKDGYSYLSPVTDRDNVTITSYSKWEQAFRVYSNILTSKFPAKSTELLQYNHTIHTASTTYSWDNVYAYDREFRHHISRHPYRSWSIILQQAWTMILKDRIVKSDNFFQRGNQNSQKGEGTQREACKHFNKGRCHYGLSCKFDHRCTVLKCGKFGYGAHICRLRQRSNDSTSTTQEGTSHGPSTSKARK